MPLSEQEQRLLEEMERSLYHNDADFVAGGARRSGRPTYSMVVTGVLIALVGLAALIAGVVIRQPVVGVIGFVAMLAGVLLAVTPGRSARARNGSAHSARPNWDGGTDEREE
jgi:uncharacterized membrane protein HdeD (DUF308 family)